MNNVMPLGQPKKPDAIRTMEQKLIDTTITGLMERNGFVEQGEKLSIGEEKKRIAEAGCEILISRYPNKDGLFDKIHIRLMKKIDASTITIEAKEKNG